MRCRECKDEMLGVAGGGVGCVRMMCVGSGSMRYWECKDEVLGVAGGAVGSVS